MSRASGGIKPRDSLALFASSLTVFHTTLTTAVTRHGYDPRTRTPMPRIIDVYVRGLAVLLVLGWFFEPARCQAQAAPSAEQPKPYVYVPHPDESESFDEVFAITGGGGLDSSSPRRSVEYAGIKIGAGCCVRGKHPDEDALTVTFDLGYDRLRTRNGVSGEFSVMIPVIRLPNPGTNESKRFIRVYAEPGAGIRVGGGEFAYFSAKAMIALMSDKQISTFSGCPILEIQRRLPFSAPTNGDTRVMIGFMYPLCKHCGFD
jgi:hypothetical protein